MARARRAVERRCPFKGSAPVATLVLSTRQTLTLGSTLPGCAGIGATHAAARMKLSASSFIGRLLVKRETTPRRPRGRLPFIAAIRPLEILDQRIRCNRERNSHQTNGNTLATHCNAKDAAVSEAYNLKSINVTARMKASGAKAKCRTSPALCKRTERLHFILQA